MASNYKHFFSDEQYKKLNGLLKSLNKGSFTITLSPGVAEGDNFCGIIIDVEIKWFKEQHASTSHLTVKVIPNQSGVPTAVSILDWQLSRLASPAVDLATIIFSAADKNLRSRYDEIVLEYYKALSSFLEELGSDVKDLLPFKTLQNELKTYSIVGLFTAIHLIYVYTTSQNPPDILHDHCHSEGFSFVYELENRSEFDKRVRDAVIDFDRLGYNFC